MVIIIFKLTQWATETKSQLNQSTLAITRSHLTMEKAKFFEHSTAKKKKGRKTSF